MVAPKIADAKKLVAIKGFEITPVIFDSNLGAITTASIHPELPLGLKIVVENNAAVLLGIPVEISALTRYTISAKNNDGECNAFIEIIVLEAPIQKQRGEVILVHDARQDLDTPRSQIENAMSDDAMMGSTIKPHEKFAMQPMGDDKRLSQQTANNPEAENRAQHSPELTPSPSAKLQAQAVLAATPQITPKPGT